MYKNNLNFITIGHTLSQTTSEGPGQRFAIWVQGCHFRCPKCCNKELWSFKKGKNVKADDLLKEILSTENIEGITIIGGEPFLQAKELAYLTKKVREKNLSVVIFTGYTLEELKTKNKKEINKLLENCDVLIDGRYEENKPSKYRWVGSGNQKVHFFTSRYNTKDFLGDNTVEIRFDGKNLFVNGWPSLF